MTVIKAIEILKNQFDKIDSLKKGDKVWISQTKDYIVRFFSITSEQYNFLKNLDCYADANYGIDLDLDWKKRKADLKSFITSCIETLKSTNKLYKEPKHNFLNLVSDNALWTIIGVVLPGLISIGFFCGNLFSDKQNIELKNENKLLKDSLSIYQVHHVTEKASNNKDDTAISNIIKSIKTK